jgi:hypothetical protein
VEARGGERRVCGDNLSRGSETRPRVEVYQEEPVSPQPLCHL